MGSSYRVTIQPAALQDARNYVEYLRLQQQASEQVTRQWFDRLVETINSLAQKPHRCPIAAVLKEPAFQVRYILHYSHRILFIVREEDQEVVILRVYHSARRPIRPDDLFQ